MLTQVMNYYSNVKVQEQMILYCEDREVVGSYMGKKFARRPDVINFRADIVQCVRDGVTSFHSSQELWNNPLNIKKGMTRKELDANRKAWDLIIDIDCPVFEISRKLCELLVDTIELFGIKNVGMKFSGNKGFHICVPHTSFPQKVKLNADSGGGDVDVEVEGEGVDISSLFPKIPRNIVMYLKYAIRKDFQKWLFKNYEVSDLLRVNKKTIEDLPVNDKGRIITDDPFFFAEIDEVLLSSRHLFRSPYSLHEKDSLVSLPINRSELTSFERMDARPDLVCQRLNSNISDSQPAEFIKPHTSEMDNEAQRLLTIACNHVNQIESEKEEQRNIRRLDVKYNDMTNITSDMFPPCIKNALQPKNDARKRILFLLTNFFSAIGLNSEQAFDELSEWNSKNNPPMPETLLVSKKHDLIIAKERLMPPNCGSTSLWCALNLCTPDALCKKIRNPVSYCAIKKKK